MKKLLYILILILLSVPSFAQDKSQPGNIDVRIGLSDLGSLRYGNVYGVYGLNVNYRASKYIAGGVQFGYGATKLYSYVTGKSVIGTHIILYGLSATFYFTPLYNKAPDPKVGFYIRGKIGAYNLYPTEYQAMLVQETGFDYGGYIGIEYNPFKRLGIFGEVGYGEKNLSQIGLSIKLGK